MISSRNNTWCDHLAEAGWLLAMTVTASFFNVYSHRTFELDRVLVLRTIAIVVTVGWLLQALQSGLLPRGGSPARAFQRFFRSPLVAPALIYALVSVLATITSLVPALSFWGSYWRLQGAYAVFAYVVIFLFAARGLRDPARRERLVTLLICTSAPVAVYGLMQGLGWDPVLWTTGFGERVSSTLGNPIFLGAYLIMVLPFVLHRLLRAWTDPGQRKSGQGPRRMVLAGYLIILVLQVACLLITRSRGPMLGLLAGALAFVFFGGLVAGRRRWVLLGAGAAVVLAVGLTLALLVQPTVPLSEFLALERGTALQRILTWQGVAQMAAASPLRTVLGYGPDAMVIAFPPFYPPELAPLPPEADTVFDRAHNVILEHLVSAGLAGVGAYLLVLGGVFFYVLRALGLIQGGSHRRWFLVAMGAAVVAGALLPRLLDGEWRFAGLGVGLGVVAGVFVYGAYAAWRLAPAAPQDWGRAGPLVALLAAVAAHVVEGQFGIEIATTRLLFWTFAGLAAAMAVGESEEVRDQVGEALLGGRRRRRARRTGPAAPAAAPPQQEPWAATPKVVALVVAVLMASLAFDFIHPEVHVGPAVATLAALVVIAWGTGAFVVWESRSSWGLHGLSDRPSGWFSTYTLQAWGWFLVFLVPHALLSGLWNNGVAALGAFYLYVIVTMLLVVIIQTRVSGRLVIQVDLRALAWLLLLIVGGALVVITNLNIAWADVVLKGGFDYADGGQWDEAISSFDQATRLAPYQDFYATYLAGAYVRKAATLRDPSQAAVWFQRSQEVLQQGWRLNPLNSDHPARLGLLHRKWAGRATSVAEQQAHLRQALAFYTQAVTLNPQNARIQRELGMSYHDLGNLTAAVAAYRRSQSLRPEIVETYLLLGQAILEQGDVAAARAVYGEAIGRDRAGALGEARASAAGRPEGYAAHLSLAMVYWGLGDLDRAQAEAEEALRLAPAARRETVEGVIREMER